MVDMEVEGVLQNLKTPMLFSQSVCKFGKDIPNLNSNSSRLLILAPRTINSEFRGREDPEEPLLKGQDSSRRGHLTTTSGRDLRSGITRSRNE